MKDVLKRLIKEVFHFEVFNTYDCIFSEKNRIFFQNFKMAANHIFFHCKGSLKIIIKNTYILNIS